MIEELTLPITEDLNSSADAGNQNFWYKDFVRRDDTLQSLLSRMNIRNRDAYDFVRSNSVASQIARSLIPGRQIEAETDADGNLINLEYQLAADQYISIKKSADSYEAEQIQRQLDGRSSFAA